LNSQPICQQSYLPYSPACLPAQPSRLRSRREKKSAAEQAGKREKQEENLHFIFSLL
jgi:hypothetical protein